MAWHVAESTRLKHLTAVELNWFVRAYAGAHRELEGDEGAVTADETASDLADAYREAIAVTRVR
ncbi:hypothetical protein [Streptomyces sp. NPDC051218]|uniref:hypothetical protein n=1 Tax=Streptomyces sp. NPDC051218 TaxID=3365645 RepID=UPI0037B72517